jgi:hypothetical protein
MLPGGYPASIQNGIASQQLLCTSEVQAPRRDGKIRLSSNSTAALLRGWFINIRDMYGALHVRFSVRLHTNTVIYQTDGLYIGSYISSRVLASKSGAWITTEGCGKLF